MSKLKVGALSVLMAISALQTTRAQTAGILVYVPHYDGGPLNLARSPP